MRVRNATKNTWLAQAAEVADTSQKRRRGLLGRQQLLPGQGLWIVPCEAIHTFGMNFHIDAIFLSRDRRVVKLYRELPPGRLAGSLTCYSVLELPAGTIAATQTEPGDQLEFLPDGQPAGNLPQPSSV